MTDRFRKDTILSVLPFSGKEVVFGEYIHSLNTGLKNLPTRIEIAFFGEYERKDVLKFIKGIKYIDTPTIYIDGDEILIDLNTHTLHIFMTSSTLEISIENLCKFTHLGIGWDGRKLHKLPFYTEGIDTKPKSIFVSFEDAKRLRRNGYRLSVPRNRMVSYNFKNKWEKVSPEECVERVSIMNDYCRYLHNLYFKEVTFFIYEVMNGNIIDIYSTSWNRDFSRAYLDEDQIYSVGGILDNGIYPGLRVERKRDVIHLINAEQKDN